MKYLNLTLIFVCFSIIANAQILSLKEKKVSQKSGTAQNYEHNPFVKTLTNYVNSNNIKSIEQKLDSFRIVGDDGTIYERNLFKYDSYGNCIESVWFMDNESEGNKHTSAYKDRKSVV